MSAKARVVSFFTPTQIPGCQLWLDAADRSSLLISGSNVTQWNDKSGNGRNATASVEGTYSVSTRAVVFNNSFYTTTYPANPTNESGFYVFLTTSSGGPQMILGANQGGREIAIYNNGNQFGIINSLVSWGALTAGGTITPNTMYLGTSEISNGTSTSISLNGALTLSGPTTVPAFTAGVLTSLGREAGTSLPFIGSAHEIILFNRLLSIEQRQQVEGYLAWKWGLQANLPATHPYKLSIIPPLLNPPSVPTTLAQRPFFLPTQIASCALWLDAADSSTLSLSGSSVTQWRDKSGRNFHCQITAGANGPTYSSSLRLLQFRTASSQSLTISQDFGTLVTGNQYSIFFVGRRQASGYQYFLSGAATVPRQNIMLGYTGLNNTTTDFNLYADEFGSTVPTYSANDSVRILGFSSYSASRTIRVDGSLGATSGLSGTVTAFSTPMIGRRYSGGDTIFHNIDLYEMITFIPALTPVQLQQVEGYLAHKWGLQANLPATHPFRFSLLPESLAYIRPAWQPLLIPGCQLWVDAADSTSMSFSGSSVTQLRDKSGLGHIFTATGTPTLQANSLNGLSSLSFNGSSYLLNNTSILPVLNHTIFCVAAASNVSNTAIGNFISFASGTIVGEGDSNAFVYRFYTNISGITNAFDIIGLSYRLYIDLANTNPNIIAETISSGTGGLHINGVVPTYLNTDSISGGSGNTLGCVLGCRWQGASGADRFYRGNIYEVIAFNSVLTATQRQEVEGYLAWKWGLQGSLPSNHLFRTGVPQNPIPIQSKKIKSVWQPTRVSGCQLWLDAADRNSLLITGSNVTQWNDKSGNSYNATQTVSGSRPSYSGNFITFSNNAYLDFPQAAINNTTTYALFLVFFPIASINWILQKQFNGVASYNMLSMTKFWIDSTGITNNLYWGPHANTGVLNSEAVLSLNTLQMIEVLFDGTSLTFYRNGTLLNTVTSGPTLSIVNQLSATNCTIGSWRADGNIRDSGVTNFQMNELNYYNVALTTLQRQQVEGYLAWKWGLQANLPANHPFKGWPPSP